MKKPRAPEPREKVYISLTPKGYKVTFSVDYGGTRTHVGTFPTLEEAQKVKDETEKENGIQREPKKIPEKHLLRARIRELESLVEACKRSGKNLLRKDKPLPKTPPPLIR